MQLSNLRLVGCGVVVAALASCAAEEPTSTSTMQGSLTAAGALVDLSMDSKVGVLLDEFPPGPLREAAAADALARADAFWQQRAMAQARLMFYRMVFRSLYYPADWSNASKQRGPLPLPPRKVWDVALGGKATRVQDNGHDVVVRNYNFHSVIVSDANSVAQTEPNLAKIGGTWDETFNFPTDPELLLQRTGYACMDEDEYPPGSVFEENTYYFYDDTCKQEAAPNLSCHLTAQPQESCVEALTKHTGIVKTSLHFKRIPYTAATASKYRVGTITNANGADLEVVEADMEEETRLMYRFFGSGSCELEEGVIGTLGWRHLLAFSASVRNNGTRAIHIGKVSDPTNPWVLSKVFEFSPCHGHYHFSHYGDFRYNGAPGSKRAFCLEETNRFHNDETTPVTATHQSCDYQGIGPGWGDEYEFGIPGQWVDVTGVESSTPLPLTFDSNIDQFMCEGATLDKNGVQVDPTDLSHIAFTPSKFTTASGAQVSRISCDFPATWNNNNHGSIPVATAPGSSFITSACNRGQYGPNRDCDFAAHTTKIACNPGATVKLHCSAAGAAMVTRVCDTSAALGIGIPCSVRDSMANAITTSAGADLTFACPVIRDATTTGGYALFVAPLLANGAAGTVSCTVQ